MKYFNVLNPPFSVEGLAVAKEGLFQRLPEDLIDNVNPNVSRNARKTAGACVRFRTDSTAVAVKVTLKNNSHNCLENVCGAHGVDVFFDGRFGGVAYPERDDLTEYEGTVAPPYFIETEKPHDVRINLPISDAPVHMEIGIDDGASLLPPTPHRIEKPVVFYGSSITQGYFSTRPGVTYVSALAMRLDFELINLGFGSGAHGELNMADYINAFDMSAFVMDYDHNDDVPALLERHEPFFKRIREKHPYLPIILPSRPDFDRKAINAENRAVVRATFDNAVAAGDKNVYYIDGETFYGNADRDGFTMDRVHPNDAGMRAMADGMFPVLSNILYNK
ncbi:MAG: hypothetical protein IJS65_07855 [Clostridia bacterium]|nr:hypothetical protein [Clostridia bacterium]